MIKSEIEELGIPVTLAAKALGVTRQQLYRVIRGDCAITADMAWRLEKAIGGDAGLWLRMQANYDLAQVRRRKPQPSIRKLTAKKVA
jgi:addiction module HigA family antidote